MKKRFTVVYILTVFLLFIAGSAHAFSYTLKELGNLGYNQTRAYAINNTGAITGQGNIRAYDHPGFIWEDCAMENIGYLTGINYSAGYDINNNRQIVGSSAVGRNSNWAGIRHAHMWDDGEMVDLGTTGTQSSVAKAINDNEEIVGYGYVDSWSNSKAFYWKEGVMTELETPSENSRAFDINNSSQIVGNSYDTAGNRKAVLWENGIASELGTVGGSNSVARAINESGKVIGYSESSDGTQHAFLYENNSMTDLGTLNGWDTFAEGINNQGSIVGRAYLNGINHPFLWQDGIMTDLYTEVATQIGIPIQSVLFYDINDMGWIVGNAGTADGTNYVILLTPNQTPATSTPEPATLSLLVSGLLGIVALRKSTSRFSF